MCVRTCVCACVHMAVEVRVEFMESVLSFHLSMGSEIWTQFIQKCLYPLSHPVDPLPYFWGRVFPWVYQARLTVQWAPGISLSLCPHPQHRFYRHVPLLLSGWWDTNSGPPNWMADIFQLSHLPRLRIEYFWSISWWWSMCCWSRNFLKNWV